MHDRLTNPLDTALYWVEYVIRHHGAPQLRTVALELNWFQLYLVDVMAFLLLIASIFAYLLYYVVNLFVRKKNKKEKKQ